MNDDLHIMVDIETLGTRPDAAILSIGIVVFAPYRFADGRDRRSPRKELRSRASDGSRMMPLRDQDRARPREPKTREGHAREARTFVSGLPGADLADRSAPAAALAGATVPADGDAWLDRIRARAAEDAALLEPATQARFDGAERLPADPEAAAAHRTCSVIVALVDLIKADRTLHIRIAAALARHPL